MAVSPVLWHDFPLPLNPVVQNTTYILHQWSSTTALRGWQLSYLRLSLIHWIFSLRWETDRRYDILAAVSSFWVNVIFLTFLWYHSAVLWWHSRGACSCCFSICKQASSHTAESSGSGSDGAPYRVSGALPPLPHSLAFDFDIVHRYSAFSFIIFSQS